VFTSIAIVACASRAAVVLPPSGNPGLQSVADRVHALAVLVRARALIGERTDGGGLRVHEALSLASGVLIGNGLALTELGAVTLTAADGRREVASQIEVVVDDVGPLPAHVLAADAALDLAVLRLPDEARALPGALLAPDDPDIGDPLLAVGADGDSLDAVGVHLTRVDSGADGTRRLRTDRALPAPFWGGPLFDARGRLGGLNTPPAGAAGTAVPASLLRSAVAKVPAAALRSLALPVPDRKSNGEAGAAPHL